MNASVAKHDRELPHWQSVRKRLHGRPVARAGTRTKILGTYSDIVGGVTLEDRIDGFQSWNLTDLLHRISWRRMRCHHPACLLCELAVAKWTRRTLRARRKAGRVVIPRGTLRPGMRVRVKATGRLR